LSRTILRSTSFRHALGELVGATQRRAAAEHEAEIAGIHGSKSGQRLDDIPILLDKRRAREPKMLLDFE